MNTTRPNFSSTLPRPSAIRRAFQVTKATPESEHRLGLVNGALGPSKVQWEKGKGRSGRCTAAGDPESPISPRANFIATLLLYTVASKDIRSTENRSRCSMPGKSPQADAQSPFFSFSLHRPLARYSNGYF